MNINVRADSVEIEGYVNAIERLSKPLMSRMGQFVERICKGAFKKALKRNDDVKILLNHDWNRNLGSTRQGNLELEEDNIGLHARATITDPEVVEKAKRGDLVGWSFGFTDRDVDNKIIEGMPTRAVKDLDLYEVSILDRRKTPAYDGTLIATREETSENHFIGDNFVDEVNYTNEEEKDLKIDFDKPEEEIRTEEQEEKTQEEVQEEPKQEENTEDVPKQHENVEENKSIDYTQYENLIKEMKGDF